MLDDRKKRVLRAIVDDYIATAEPVGSRTIARKYRLGVSPATIRNEMADLEELGYLEQPHTSAGRIPSDKGYRFYVDRLMLPARLTEEDVSRIRRIYEEKAREIQTLIHQTARVLAETTNYLALVLGPQLEKATFQRLTLVPLRPGLALLVLVTDAGFVQTASVEVPQGVRDEELHHIAQVLTVRLAGVPIDVLAEAALKELQDELSAYRGILRKMVEVLVEVVQDSVDDRVYMGGASRIFEQPEFRDVNRARAVLGVLEHEQTIRELLNANAPDQGVMVAIGGETGMDATRECSLVCTTYEIAGVATGRIGLLGPKRMDYARAVAILRYVEDCLSMALSRSAG